MFSSCKEMLDFTTPQEEDSYLYVKDGDDVRFILLLY
jgi:hypothetical protein